MSTRIGHWGEWTPLLYLNFCCLCDIVWLDATQSDQTNAHLKFHFFPPRRRAQLCALCVARIKYQHGKQSKTILTNKQNDNPILLNPFWLLNHGDQMLKRIYYWRVIPLKDNIVQKKERKCKKVVLKKAGILHDTRVWTHLDVSDISVPAKHVNASSPR